jgi:O-antigen/teichoic acid export membrane protein
MRFLREMTMFPRGKLVESLSLRLQHLLELLRDRLLRNAGYLLGVTAVNAIVGFIFWTLAARLYTTEQVGLASSVVSVTALLAGIASLGLGVGLVRFLPERVQPQRTLNAVLTLTVLTSLTVGAVYLIGVRSWSPTLTVLAERPVYAVGFLVFVVVMGWSSLLQMAYVGRREAAYAFWQMVVMNALRVTLVVGLVQFGAPGLVGSAALAVGTADLLGVLVFLPRLVSGYRPCPVWAPDEWRPLVPYSVGNYTADLLYRAPMLLAPLMALERLGAASSAHAYMGWMLGTILASPGAALASSMFAEGSHTPRELRPLLLRALRYAAGVTVPLALIVGVAAPWVLSLFGPSYAAEATSLMRWLAVAAPLMAFANLYFAGLRVRKRVREMILLSAAVAVISLILPLLWLDSRGLGSMGQGWLIAQGLVTVVAMRHLMPRRAPAEQDAGPVEE